MKKTILALVAAAGLAFGQHSKDAKPHTLKGKVTAVGKDTVTVDHGDVPGFMAAMTMPYKVEKLDILSKVKTGDQIEATVYDGDYTLYEVKVVGSAQGKAKSK